MIRKLVLATVAVIAPVVLASSAVAQEQATLVLRSGQRVSGSLIDLNRSGFTVRVSGNERQFDLNEIARIEFSGDANLPSGQQWKAGDHAFVLTDGSVVHGRLYDIGGRNPLRISVDTASGRRDLSSNEIRAIHFVNPSSVGGGTGTSGSNIAVPEGAGIAVPANQQWVDSGIIVRQGQRVRFSARGEAQLSADAKDRAIPQGSLTGRRAPNAPLPQELAGALIARVGSGQPFAVSNAAEITISENGRLMLGINDDVVTDNQGGYRVEVTPQGGRR